MSNDHALYRTTWKALRRSSSSESEQSEDCDLWENEAPRLDRRTPPLCTSVVVGEFLCVCALLLLFAQYSPFSQLWQYHRCFGVSRVSQLRPMFSLSRTYPRCVFVACHTRCLSVDRSVVILLIIIPIIHNILVRKVMRVNPTEWILTKNIF